MLRRKYELTPIFGRIERISMASISAFNAVPCAWSQPIKHCPSLAAVVPVPKLAHEYF